MDKAASYESQKKYLSNRKQLRVWVEMEKYQRFEAKVRKEGESIYSLINKFIDEYLNEEAGD